MAYDGLLKSTSKPFTGSAIAMGTMAGYYDPIKPITVLPKIPDCTNKKFSHTFDLITKKCIYCNVVEGTTVGTVDPYMAGDYFAPGFYIPLVSIPPRRTGKLAGLASLKNDL